ncbi:hypothetical protein FB451DRAFT_1214357 [Mycena latifolia]|nr:hypothetical protein FB451DRAFT_1214357 [Mycena latifolia]
MFNHQRRRRTYHVFLHLSSLRFLSVRCFIVTRVLQALASPAYRIFCSGVFGFASESQPAFSMVVYYNICFRVTDVVFR